MKTHLKMAAYVLAIIAVAAFILKMFPSVRATVAPYLTF